MDKRKLMLSYVLNLIMMILFIASIIVEVVNIHNNPDSLYKNVWGLFRYFTIDGNLMSFVFTTIIFVKQYQSFKKKEDESQTPSNKSQFLYTISLMSACTDFVIFVVVVFIFIPMSFNSVEWIINLVGTFNSSSLHVTIPILLNIRFIFFDERERDFQLYEKFIGGMPMFLYGITMFILCGAKVFLSFGDNGKDGDKDGKIPYPFFDIYHESWAFCTFVSIFIFAFGFGIGFLLDFLNKKFENKFFNTNQNIETERDDSLINEAS